MNKFILKKSFNLEAFDSYLKAARDTNQFTNYGMAVQLLEQRARIVLKIDDSKAIIATNNGSTALHAIIYAMSRQDNKSYRVATQDFTFPCNSQGPAGGPIVVDVDANIQIDLNDQYLSQYADMVIVTNCFGHLQNLDYILENTKGKKVIFDNAASPYSFWRGTNSCNLGNASFISLHHTKPLGFGEGGLVIIDKEYEESVRIACNFGLVNGAFNERGGNFKMSELAAAGILQWWDSFDIDSLQKQYLDNYYKELYALRDIDCAVFPHLADNSEIFFPNCLPLIHKQPVGIVNYPDRDVKKYYYPLRGFANSQYVYDRIMCFPITRGIND
jgi:dTDP-4-amino-4,6-dideoxygalactose transaminase